MAEKAKSPKFYFNLKRETENLRKDTTAYTPAISLIIGLAKAFEMLKPEGAGRNFCASPAIGGGYTSGDEGDQAGPCFRRGLPPMR